MGSEARGSDAPPAPRPAAPLSAQQRRAHDEACRRGDAGYLDPLSGLFVMTEVGLRDRGHCCGNACRHCPYGWDAVPAARRARRLAEWGLPAEG